MAAKKDPIREEREFAWIGDAVLALFARQWVLQERGCMDGEWFTKFTSNDFLSCIGNPTSVEAKIGRIYREKGIDEAFTWIAMELLPVFMKQVASKGRR